MQTRPWLDLPSRGRSWRWLLSYFRGILLKHLLTQFIIYSHSLWLYPAMEIVQVYFRFSYLIYTVLLNIEFSLFLPMCLNRRMYNKILCLLYSLLSQLWVRSLKPKLIIKYHTWGEDRNLYALIILPCSEFINLHITSAPLCSSRLREKSSSRTHNVILQPHHSHVTEGQRWPCRQHTGSSSLRGFMSPPQSASCITSTWCHCVTHMGEKSDWIYKIKQTHLLNFEFLKTHLSVVFFR